MQRPTHRRAVAAVVAVTAAALLPGAAPVGAAPTEACAPTPKVASSFCITSDVSINHESARPVKLAFELANTSAGTTSATWLSEVTVAADPGTSGQFGVTPSAQMPLGQVVAGSPSCTSPAFADCVGHGTAKITVSGIGAGHYDGTFGVRRVTNVNPPTEGARAEYAGILDICLPYGGDQCFFQIQEEFTVTIAEVAGPDPLALTLPTRFAGTISGGGSYDAAVHTFALAISGTSNQLFNGSTVEPTPTTRVLSTPQRCGTVTSTVTGKTGESTPRVVSTTHSHTVTRCPVARFGVVYDSFTARFDGAASTAATGRELRRWVWDFGDGITKVTKVPTVSHQYDTGGNHVATLRVTDSAGAVSRALARTVRGTTTTLTVTKTADEVSAAGAVSPQHDGSTVTVVLERKIGDAFEAVASKKPILSNTSRYATTFARRPAGQCRLRVTFAGDDDHLGSRAAKGFSC